MLGGAALGEAPRAARRRACALILRKTAFTGRGGSSEFYTSGDPAEFAAHAEGLLGYGIAGHVTPRAPTVWRTEYDESVDLHAQHRGCDTDDQGIVDFQHGRALFQDGDTSCFSYLETDVTGLEGTRTSVIVRPDEVVVDRDGMITGRMVFREREKNSLLLFHALRHGDARREHEKNTPQLQ